MARFLQDDEDKMDFLTVLNEHGEFGFKTAKKLRQKLEHEGDEVFLRGQIFKNEERPDINLTELFNIYNDRFGTISELGGGLDRQIGIGESP